MDWEDDRQTKVIATKLYNLGLILRTHLMEGEN